VDGDSAVKVLIIPEDPTLDRYILKPIVEQIFADFGRIARVMVLENPRLRGVDQALDAATTTLSFESTPRWICS
jgi:hypothetical protein